MNDLKKQLIAQINEIEAELYAERERVSKSKLEISTHQNPYILGVLLVVAIPLVFFLRSKKNLKGIANSLVTVGKFALVSFGKKHITDLLEKK